MKHYYQTIKGWFNWPELYARAVQLAPKKSVFIEIGCYLGKSTSCLAVEAINSGKDITIYCLDLWEPANKIGCTVDQFMENLQPAIKAGARIVTVRGDSVFGSSLFKDDSVDFVWVDGDWIRFQSPTCYYGKNGVLRPASGGWVWWARSKSKDWTPEGLK